MDSVLTPDEKGTNIHLIVYVSGNMRNRLYKHTFNCLSFCRHLHTYICTLFTRGWEKKTAATHITDQFCFSSGTVTSTMFITCP